MDLFNQLINNKFKVVLAAIIGFVGLSVYFIKRRNYCMCAAKALNYLTIKIITCSEECDEAVNELQKRSKKHKALGFDCEWVSTFGQRNPVALLQLSTYDGFCALFRLNLMKEVPESLQALLVDDTIYKLGVAPSDDAKYLCEDYSVATKSILDIRHIAQICGHAPGGLATLTKNHLGIILDKSWRLRCGDWEAETLTNSQIIYAAADAHVAVRIFVKLIDGYGSGLFGLRFRRHNAIWKDLHGLCEKFIDLGFKPYNIGKANRNTLKKKKYPHLTRSKPLYHNCFLQAPDGELLCTCDDKKANWYVEKGLADKLSDDPLTVRLKFEPAGRSVGQVGRYYQLTKENKCVVCGNANTYIRKNVVPREYRKYFPEIMKDHSSHDVLLLCSNCHQQSNIKDLHMRLRLADKCNAPLDSQSGSSKFWEDAYLKKIRSAARALLYQARRHHLPEQRWRELEQVVLQHFTNDEQVTPKLLAEAANIRVIFPSANYENHGEKVVKHYLKMDGGLLRLEKEWRQHFLDSMQPKCMPQLWSIKHNEERLRLKYEEGRLREKDIELIGMTRWLRYIDCCR